jgi:hypothetical protein
MKLLLFYMPSFWYQTHEKSIPEAPDMDVSVEVTECIVALIQAEADDAEKGKKILDKLIKNIKWLAGKFGTKKAVLHFFSHLSESRADPDYAEGSRIRGPRDTLRVFLRDEAACRGGIAGESV